ncbi:MAG: DNA mismatch repair endonuclease MutL [Dehalococcoidia bacterium]
MMPPILLLPPSVAERIAAGEVIDRPAAAVKELIENAIDAGATEIRVEARGGGLRLIRVTDNGHGIPADEVELALQRHATSKLRTIEDLDRIDTLGFRGEALASIGAMAELTLLSATEASTAVSCTFRAGRLLERVTAARAAGTTVTVRDLFTTMPARLKFMRGARGEAAQIGAVVRRFALGRPDLRLSLTLDAHVAFRSEGGDLRTSLAAVYGAETAEAAMPMDPFEAAGAQMWGMLGGRNATRANRTQIALFINGRYVRPQPLLAAIEEGYRRLLPRGRHPIGAVFLTVPPADLDVNIHPAKLDVRLRHETEICAALAEAVRSTYSRNATVLTRGAQLSLSGGQRRLSGLSRRVSEERPQWGWEEGAASVTMPESEALPALRLAGQLHNALIVAETEHGFYLVDQHRAHERIIYERLIAGSGGERQALIEPALVQLPPAAARRLAARLPELEALGFSCEEFGTDRFLLRGVPADADLAGIAASLPDFIREAAEAAEGWHEALLASLSCRAAIRKGRPLSLAEARDLLLRLGAVSAPALCPHGSPVMIYLPEPFLSRQFDWS